MWYKEKIGFKNLSLNRKVLMLMLFLFISASYSCALVVSDSSNGELTLKIKVKTNVDSFICEYKDDFDFNKTEASSGNKNCEITDELILSVSIVKIECINEIMNRDLRNLLSSELYPDITVRINDFKSVMLKGGIQKTTADISIRGISVKYFIVLSNTQILNKTYTLGSISINLNDFGIDPPSKFMGLVEVNPVIGIDFILEHPFSPDVISKVSQKQVKM